MIILAITLTAWAILRKYAQKPARRAAMPVYAAPVLSPAEINRREKERERAQRDAERAAKQRQREEEKARKVERERQQAVADAAFYIEQIDKLYIMLWDADADLKAAREACQHDNDMNAHGAVIPDKIAAKHRAERDKLARRVMQLENSIHAKETKLTKAQQIVADYRKNYGGSKSI